MFVYLSKKISIPNNVQLHAIAWSHGDGYIAAGGAEGLLKVLKLEATNPKEGVKGLAAASNLSINQNLEGHSGAIQVVAWNEVHQKLTTSDVNGLIIVWMMYKGSWYEEMINNRNKSVVTDMAWSFDGTKICIVYEDGIVIVGSVDGNRLWSKEVGGSLVAVEWAPSCKFLMFGLSNGELHVYDTEGNFVSVGEGHMVSVRWYNPRRARANDGADGAVALAPPLPPTSASSLKPTLAIVYQHGAVQIMRHENDTEPTIFHLDKLVIVSARWNGDGTMMAVAGSQLDLPEGEQNVVLFVTLTGQRIRTLRVPGKEIAGCSWELSGLRMCLAVDSHIFFANIRPDYKWAYCGETVVYSHLKPERTESCVVFWDVKLEEVYVKYVKDLLQISACGDYCVVANRADDPSGKYLLQLCNGIGTPVDFKYIELEPIHVAMTSTHVLVASREGFYLWQYTVPRKPTANATLALPRMRVAQQREMSHVVKFRIYHIDDIVSDSAEPHDVKQAFSALKLHEQTSDSICCICVTEKCFLLARESGLIHKYSFPNAALLYKYTLATRPEKIALNNSGTRLAVINSVGVLNYYDLDDSQARQVIGFERKDIWNIMWDADNDEMLAIMEKTRMFVLRGTEPEVGRVLPWRRRDGFAKEPVINSGYICRFKDLTVRTVLIDELMRNPEQPEKDLVVDIEIKSLRDAKQLLEKMNIQEASAYIEQNSHPKLWSLLAEVALNQLDTATAEHAFVKLKDYAGIQFVKKVNNIHSESLKKAEIAAYFGRFDEAEKIYLDNDRRDLAIELRQKVHDWFRILQLLQVSTGPGDDALLQEAWNHVGDYFADRQKWANAERHYEAGHNQAKLAKCYFMLEDYDKLEALMKSLPDGHELLPEVGAMFSNAGLCEQAVQTYIKNGQVKSALDVCIQLNNWELAVQLARDHDVSDIDALLTKYAEQLTGDAEKTLAAVQLYRKAGRFLDAAKLIYQIAQEEKDKQASPLRLKKLFVLAALLIEQYHDQNKAKAVADKGKRQLEAKAALSGLLQEDSASVTDSKIIDSAWRGAEAYHFYMLAQRQLYEGNVDATMKTALHLTEYDDVLDPLEVFSLLALASCANRQFSVCSRAFVKLESIGSMAPEEKEAYQKLALDIFTKSSPKDSRSNKAECTGCEVLIPDYCQICPSCDTKFPTCIVTGRPLMDYQFWLCPVCKHRAYEQEIHVHKFCPLCHTAM